MSIKISELSKKLGITAKALQEKIKQMGFEIKKGEKTITDDLAELIEAELSPKTEESVENLSKAEVYEEIINQELEKEIVKKQRKQLSHKDKILVSDKKDGHIDQGLPTTIIKTVEIPEIITVKEFSEKTGLSAAKIIGELMKNGILANINQRIDYDTAVIVADDLGIKLKKKLDEATVTDISEGNLEHLLKDEEEYLVKRPPVISVMGHVDHGKTKLLDMIRETNVIATEAGGITQHIGAYQVEKKGEKITFLDTPGHKAFTEMRARGARATDIAILVVSASEGVKPQTIEAINHAKEANIPIIVALNKIDLEDANVDRVQTQLAELGLQPEKWGGNTPVVPLSALTGQGIDALLDTILIVAEMQNLKANPNRDAVGTVIESNLDVNLGPIATILVNTGTLNVMDSIIVGESYGRIKVMKDYLGKRIKKLGPSGVAVIAGLSKLPLSGDVLQVVKDEKTARLKAIEICEMRKLKGLNAGGGLNEIISKVQRGKIKNLKIVLKTDTKGSLEAITQALSKIKSETAGIQVIHSGVGNITESDVLMASASDGIVIGFHNATNVQVKKIADREQVQVLLFNIIYKLTEKLTQILSGMLEPEFVTVELGKFLVKEIFYTEKDEMIVGGKVIEGKIESQAKLRVIRKGANSNHEVAEGENPDKIGEGEMLNLKIVKEEVKEVEKGNECGIRFKSNIRLMINDVLEAYKVQEVTQQLVFEQN